MALAAATVWEIRTTGDDTNGGAFVAGASGTDRSQQDAAQITYTDLVIGDPTTTELTSVGNPFTATEVGNILNITSGTGFTTGRYQVVSVAAGVATMDRSVGTAGSTGGNGKLGGALASPAVACGAHTAGNTMHVKAGTYNMSTTSNVANGRCTISTAPADGSRTRMIGYETTRLDYGAKPLFQPSAASVTMITASGNFVLLDNLAFGANAQTGSIPINSTGLYFWARRLHVDGTAQGINSSGTAGRVEECEVENVGSVGGIVLGTGNGQTCQRCWVHNCTIEGIDLAFTQGSSVIDCLVTDGDGIGILVASNSRQSSIINCTVDNCGDSGFQLQGPNTYAINCLATNNGGGGTGYGFEGLSANSNAIHLLNCGAFGNQDGATLDTQNENFVTLTADPYLNAAGGNYGLNGTAGGGFAARAAGLPSTFPGLATTVSGPDLGAVQTDVTSIGLGQSRHHLGRRTF